MEMNQYLSMFIDESRDHLQAMNDDIMALENSPEDIEIVQHIFRSAHTLKGMAATMGFEDLASLTHVMENVLDLVRNRSLQMNEDIFDALFKSLDALETMVEDIINGGTGQLDVTGVTARLKAIESGDTAGDSASIADNDAGKMRLDQYQYSVIEQSFQTEHHPYYIDVEIQEDCVLKAARAYMVFNALEQFGEIVKAHPSVEELEQDNFGNTFSLYYLSKLDASQIEGMVAEISEIHAVNVALIDKETLEQLNRTDADQATSAATSTNVERTEANNAPAAEVPAKRAGKSAVKTQTVPSPSKTIRVDIERLDVLMNLFSELLIDRVRLESLAAEIGRQDLTETVEHMSRVGSDLQNIVLKLRMVPVDTVFNRFPRMIRDLAKSLNKKVDLIISGADTELDRTVIDEIGDPLVHLLRNSLDHGIEPIDDRLQAGKPEVGTIHLRAYHSGNHVFIEIEDDGRGIMRDKVLATAIKNGVVTADQASSLSDDEVFQLLFASGFSTAEQVSDLSGRGVGLDVVKTKITSLGGQVSVSSELGRGTKFSVQLPLTLSIITAMLIRVGNEKYAIPLSSIVETAAVQASDVRTVQGTDMMHFREHVIPLLNLHQVFECPGEMQQSEEFNVVIVRKGDKHAAMIVDELIGQQEIVLKSLGSYLKHIFAISGATILGDGQVALIIDTNALVK